MKNKMALSDLRQNFRLRYTSIVLVSGVGRSSSLPILDSKSGRGLDQSLHRSLVAAIYSV
ncbi:unnamed protein product [Amoebophrya sp. A25]|nr:unnamed protein product [Amoebophrya sp. A25]|eukprot:GSA25T00021974001.1